VILSTLPLVVVCLVGFGLKQTGVLSVQDTRTIGKLLTYLALPAVILRALATVALTPDLVYLPLSALLVVVGLTGIALVLPLGRGGSRATRGALVTTFPTFEGGGVGYPLMLLAFGEVGLSRIVLFDLAQAIYLLTVVYCLSAWFGQEGVTAQAVGTKLLSTPFFWAIILGLLFNVLGLDHGLLMAFLDIVGSSFLLLVLLLLGLEFQVNVASLGFYSLMAVLKLLCGLGLGWLVANLFGLGGVERTAVMLGSALPPSMLTLLFTQENHLDVAFTTNFISIAIPLSLVMLPLLVG
jgi:predicted permease